MSPPPDRERSRPRTGRPDSDGPGEVTVRRRLLGARSRCVVADQRLPRDGGVTIGARGGRRISEVATPDRLMQTPS
jgi:hypothetical protein